MRVHQMMFDTVDELKRARDSLGAPAALNEAIASTGIDAFFTLLDGGFVNIEGKWYGLVEVEPELPL